MESNTIAVLQAKGKVVLKPHCLDPLAQDEVLVKICKVCICGVDDSCVFEGHVGDVQAEMPCGVCQACMGVVVEAGCATTDLKEGDRVTLEPGRPCCCCKMCKCGCYNLCEKTDYYISEGITGGYLAKYCKTKAHLVYKLPDCICDEDGALVQPLSVAVRACKRAGVWAGCKVLVSGAGPIGLLCVLVAKALGATCIMVTDKHECRLELAKELGADCTLLVKKDDGECVATCVHKRMGCHPDICLECSGTEKGMCACIYAVEACGKIVQVGVTDESVTLPLCHATMREVDILGLCGGTNCFELAIDMLANNCVNVHKLVSKCFEFEDCQKAFEYNHKHHDCLCCLVNCH